MIFQAEGNTQEALVHLKLKRTREQARERLIQSLLGLVEAQDVRTLRVFVIIFMHVYCGLYYVIVTIVMLQMIGQCAMNVLLTSKFCH